METAFALSGVIPPLLTPFADSGEKVDEGALRVHVEWLIEMGVHGLMPCGTTGEGPLLTISERKRVVEVVIEVADHRVPVVAHVGAPTTHETIELARHAQGCGAEAVSVVTPYYYRLSEDALIEHFCHVANAVADTFVFLYNIPQNTGNTLSLSTAKAITARCPNVIGIKDSSGQLDALVGFTGLNNGQFQVICGSDGLFLRALEAGACGGVSGNANVFPEIVVSLYRAFSQGEYDAAHQQQRLLNQIVEILDFGENLSLFKRILGLRGLRGGAVRPPLLEAAEEVVVRTEERLQSLHLL